MPKKLTQEEFIKKSNIKHDYKYDYSLVNYINSKTEVKIICPIHGVFEQIPNSHLKSHGCFECGLDRTISFNTSNTQEFIEKAGPKHNFKYDYSLVDYIGVKTEVKIICPTHGIFKQTPDSHLNGYGCYDCGMDRTINFHTSNTQEFIEKADPKHNFKYDYSLVKYIDAKTEVEIICPIHGIFEQTPDKHLGGCGCQLCGTERMASFHTSDTKKFIEKADPKHDYKYDYSLVKYINAKTEVKIICLKHGIFEQIPDSHLQGVGCPKCTHRISKTETLWLNLLNLPNDLAHRQVRIKILNRTLRVDGFDSETNTVYEFNGDYYHGNPAKYPPNNINPTNKKTYGELYARTLAKEALLKSAGYNVVSMWESDFKSGLDKTIKK